MLFVLLVNVEFRFIIMSHARCELLGTHGRDMRFSFPPSESNATSALICAGHDRCVINRPIGECCRTSSLSITLRFA